MAMCLATVEQTQRDVKKPYKGREGSDTHVNELYKKNLLSHDFIDY